MSTAQTLLLGAIAGGTIFLGLPMGRVGNTSHAVKAGLQTIQGHYDFNAMGRGVEQVNYQFRGGVPVGLTQFAGPFQSQTRLRDFLPAMMPASALPDVQPARARVLPLAPLVRALPLAQPPRSSDR